MNYSKYEKWIDHAMATRSETMKHDPEACQQALESYAQRRLSPNYWDNQRQDREAYNALPVTCTCENGLIEDEFQYLASRDHEQNVVRLLNYVKSELMIPPQLRDILVDAIEDYQSEIRQRISDYDEKTAKDDM